ncbi:MAG: hypothetical protein RL330_474 [Actinomycetota bacterium]
MKVLMCHHSRLLADALANMLDAVPGFEARAVVFDDADHCSVVCREDWDVVVMGQVALRGQWADTPCCHREGAAHKKVLMGSGSSVPVLVDAMHAGFDDLLNINISRDEMVDQLHALHAGQRRLADHPFFRYSEVPTEASPSHIPCRSRFDIDIVALVARAFSDKQIGEALHIAPQTVRNHLSRIMRDGGFRNRTEIALAWWREHGLPEQGAPRSEPDPDSDDADAVTG